MLLTVQTILSARLKLFTTTVNAIPACLYQAEMALNSFSKRELFWRVENLTLNHGMSLRKKEPNLMIE